MLIRRTQRASPGAQAGQSRDNLLLHSDVFSDTHTSLESARGLAQSKGWHPFEPAVKARSVLDCASPRALWGGVALTNTKQTRCMYNQRLHCRHVRALAEGASFGQSASETLNDP